MYMIRLDGFSDCTFWSIGVSGMAWEREKSRVVEVCMAECMAECMKRLNCFVRWTHLVLVYLSNDILTVS